MFLDRFSDMVSKKVNDNFAAAIEAINNKVSELNTRIDVLEQQNRGIKNLLDKHEQYSRRNIHLLKNSNFRITEDLTFARASLLRRAIPKWGNNKSVRTADGRICFKINGIVHKVETEQQLLELQKT